MLFKYLQHIDPIANKAMNSFHQDYLHSVWGLVVAKNKHFVIRNVSAQDEYDIVEYSCRKIPYKKRVDINRYLRDRLEYFQGENRLVSFLSTYLKVAFSPDLEMIFHKMAPLQELHEKISGISNEEGTDVSTLAKLIYNRTRFFHLQYGDGSLQGTPSTQFHQHIPVKDLANLLPCLVGIESTLGSILRHVKYDVLSETCTMIHQVSEALLTYRTHLKEKCKELGTNPNNQFTLQGLEPSASAHGALMFGIESYSHLTTFSVADFLMFVLEYLNITGDNLMIE